VDNFFIIRGKTILEVHEQKCRIPNSGRDLFVYKHQEGDVRLDNMTLDEVEQRFPEYFLGE